MRMQSKKSAALTNHRLNSVGGFSPTTTPSTSELATKNTLYQWFLSQSTRQIHTLNHLLYIQPIEKIYIIMKRGIVFTKYVYISSLRCTFLITKQCSSKYLVSFLRALDFFFHQIICAQILSNQHIRYRISYGFSHEEFLSWQWKVFEFGSVLLRQFMLPNFFELCLTLFLTFWQCYRVHFFIFYVYVIELLYLVLFL